MAGLFNLDAWDEEAKYLILDDISFKHIGGHRKTLWGAQKEVVLTDKFRRKRSYKWGKPMIFLCNRSDDFRYLMDDNRRNPSLYLTDSEMDWYLANSVVVEIDNKMYIEYLGFFGNG